MGASELHLMRVVVSGALEFYYHDISDITDFIGGQKNLVDSLNSIEAALMWLRNHIEAALNDNENA